MIGSNTLKAAKAPISKMTRTRGFDIWVADDDDLAFGLSPKLLVFANTEDALEELIDNISEDTGRSLADNTDFQEARAALRGQRFASVYLDARQAFDVAEITTGTGPFGQSILDYSPDWIMISAGWFERGMVMEITAPAVDDLNVTAGDLSDPGRLLPDDTLAFLAASFDPRPGAMARSTGTVRPGERITIPGHDQQNQL